MILMSTGGCEVLLLCVISNDVVMDFTMLRLQLHRVSRIFDNFAIGILEVVAVTDQAAQVERKTHSINVVTRGDIEPNSNHRIEEFVNGRKAVLDALSQIVVPVSSGEQRHTRRRWETSHPDASLREFSVVFELAICWRLHITNIEKNSRCCTWILDEEIEIPYLGIAAMESQEIFQPDNIAKSIFSQYTTSLIPISADDRIAGPQRL